MLSIKSILNHQKFQDINHDKNDKEYLKDIVR